MQEEHAGNGKYRHAVQPGQMVIPARLTNGKRQVISFPAIENQKATTKTIKLNATSDSGLTVDYYVVSGPAVIESNILTVQSIRVKSKYPVKVTVVAYQWGRTVEPLFQSAEPVIREFLIYKK